MLTLALASVLLVPTFAQPTPVVDLGIFTQADARYLDGKAVVALLTVETPPYTRPTNAGITTVVGPGRDDAAEWCVVLKGDRLRDVKEGKRLHVRGVLAVIDHPPAVVNGRGVPGWVEVRVTEQ